MSERQRAHADRASANEPGGDGVRGRSPRAMLKGRLARTAAETTVPTIVDFLQQQCEPKR